LKSWVDHLDHSALEKSESRSRLGLRCVETGIEDSRFLSPLIQESDSSSSPPAAEKTEEEVKITLEADRYETTNLRILESLFARPNLSFTSQTPEKAYLEGTQIE
jgi:hypothetical protein